MKVDVLGIKIDDVNMEEAIETVEGWLSKHGKHYVSTKVKGKVLRASSKISNTASEVGFYIVTPNPEMVMVAQKDQNFRRILNNADLAIADGVGLKLAGVKNNIPGVDLMEKLVRVASKKGYTVSFLGGRAEVAKKTAECLKKKYPGLNVIYAISGPVIPAKAGIHINNNLWIPDQVRDDKCDILFVAFGHIKQEKWIAANLEKLPVKVAMGAGGAFDYLSGQLPRAPKWMRSLGLEWLFRLVTQPWRWRRQLALIKYLFLLKLKDKSS